MQYKLHVQHNRQGMRLIRKFKRKGDRRQLLSRALGVSTEVLNLLIYWWTGATQEPNWLAVTVHMYRLLQDVTDTKQLHQYVSIKGRKTGFNVRRNVMDVQTGLYLSLTNNISFNGDVG